MAIATILAATQEALGRVDLGSKAVLYDLPGALGHAQVFKKVWLGLAGIGHESDVDAFAPLVRKAFNISGDDEDALRITNGELGICTCNASVLIFGTRRWAPPGFTLCFTAQCRLDRGSCSRHGDGWTW